MPRASWFDDMWNWFDTCKDPADADAIWVTEVWTDERSHRASLKLPAVQQAISRGKPLIASFGTSTATEPVGGHRLPPS